MTRAVERQSQQWPHRLATLRRAMPKPINLSLPNEQPDYTGSHGMTLMSDEQGDWALKQPKDSLAFTVPLEHAATSLQRQMGLEAPETHIIDHQGRPAVVSKWYPDSTQAFQQPPRLHHLRGDDQMEIQKNHVLDWLIGNHDSHVGNWLRLGDGRLVSIDKGQAAKYFDRDRLDPHFHPNYYAREPIYNQLWRDHAAGHGDMHDPRTGELGDFIHRVQSIPDDHLKEMFRPYAQLAAQSGQLLNPAPDPDRNLGRRTLPRNDPEAFLNGLVQRKNNLHNDFGDYYDRMSAGRQIVGAYKTPPGLNSIADIGRALGVPNPLIHRWLKKPQYNAPQPTHIVNDTRYWDDLDPWHEWQAQRQLNMQKPKDNTPAKTKKITQPKQPDFSKLEYQWPTNPHGPYEPNNYYYTDPGTEEELLRSLHRTPRPGDSGEFLPRRARRIR